MKILLVHGYYRERGGEDAVFEEERDLLIKLGHEVETYTLLNEKAADWPRWKQLAALFWNLFAYRDIRNLCRRFKPDVVHFHNLFPFLSPAMIWAAKRSGARLAATLHNYRLSCANGLFLRGGKACERCAGRAFGWPGVVHACYRKSRALSLLVVLGTFLHRLLGSWKQAHLVAPSQFAARKLQSATGLVVGVKPHFLGGVFPEPVATKEPYALFVGRYSEEKGVGLLTRAWQLAAPDAGGFSLKMIGDGPLKAAMPEIPGISHLGRLEASAIKPLIQKAAFVVVPSLCYETMSRVVMEAFAAGTAVIAPENSAPGSLVQEGVTGRTFKAYQPEALATTMLALIAQPEAWRLFGSAAYRSYLQHYTPEKGAEALTALYEAAC